MKVANLKECKTHEHINAYNIDKSSINIQHREESESP